jgi:hypothetical protein
VLDRAEGPSSLATSLSSVVELLGSHIDAAATHRVRRGTQSALVATLLNFSNLGTKQELLGSRRNMDLMDD